VVCWDFVLRPPISTYLRTHKIEQQSSFVKLAQEKHKIMKSYQCIQMLDIRKQLVGSLVHRTMPIDFGVILSYSINKFNNCGGVPKGDRGLN